jgi:outer membrane protein OmpU
MKKVLLATSALFLTAGVASAELSFAGKADAGIFKAGNGAAAADANYSVYTGIDINITASTTTDNGMTISAATDMGAGFILDAADKELDDQTAAANDLTAPEVKIGFNGVTIELQSEGVDDYYDGDLENYDIGVSGTFAGLSYGIAYETEENTASDYSATVGYAMGDMSITLNTNQRNNGLDAQTSVSASYTVGAVKATVKNDNMGGEGADAVNTFTIAYTAGPAVVTLSAKDDANGSWDASVVYTAGAYTISANTDEAEAWEASVAYDLGGGASMTVGADHNDTSFAGVSFAF